MGGNVIRNIIFWSHLVVAVVAGIMIFLMAVTGTLLAFEPQMVGYAERKVRYVTQPEGAERLSVQDIVAKAAEGRPNAVPASVTIKSDPKASAVVNFGKEDTVFVDPYTGAVLVGSSKFHDAMHWIESFHRRLATREKGRIATGAANAAFLFLLVSGLFLWWPKSWSRSRLKAVTVFNPNLKGKARDWNWHNVIGFWCAPFFLATTLTGLVMSYSWANNLLFKMTGNEPPPQQQKKTPPAGPGPVKGGPGTGPRKGGQPPLPVLPAVGLNAIFDRAAQQSSAWVSLGVRLPQAPEAPVVVMIEERAPFGAANPRSQLSLDPKTASVVKWEPFSEQNLGRKMRFWTKWLHTGQLFGIIGQALAGIAAVGAAMMVYTGFAMAWRRFFIKRR